MEGRQKIVAFDIDLELKINISSLSVNNYLMCNEVSHKLFAFFFSFYPISFTLFLRLHLFLLNFHKSTTIQEKTWTRPLRYAERD